MIDRLQYEQKTYSHLLALVPERVSSSGAGGQDGSASAAWISSGGVASPLSELIPEGRLPLCAGRIHIMRKVDPQGTVAFLNESWLVGKRWRGEYIPATIDTARQQVSFWHKPDEDTDWRCLKTRLFRIHEVSGSGFLSSNSHFEPFCEKFPHL
jgi:hypothetical protein